MALLKDPQMYYGMRFCSLHQTYLFAFANAISCTGYNFGNHTLLWLEIAESRDTAFLFKCLCLWDFNYLKRPLNRNGVNYKWNTFSALRHLEALAFLIWFAAWSEVSCRLRKWKDRNALIYTILWAYRVTGEEWTRSRTAHLFFQMPAFRCDCAHWRVVKQMGPSWVLKIPNP